VNHAGRRPDPETTDPPGAGPRPPDTKGTVGIALAADVAVAVAKLVAGATTGSAAMLSEGAHSVADCLNQVFLLTSLRRSGRPPDQRHPFGYGKERFFWSLLAAVGILVAGAGFSLMEAYSAFAHPRPTGSLYYPVNFAVLGVALIADGTSAVRATVQLRREARAAQHSSLQQLRTTRDLSLKTVVGEDSAALVGVVLAAAGLGLHWATGSQRWEGVAAGLIAVLLVAVAIGLGRDTRELLIGEAVSPDVTQAIRDFLVDECPAIDDVVDLLTMYLGVDSILLAARVDLAENLGSTEIEQVSAEIDREVRSRWPVITHVFIDATNVDEPEVARVGLAVAGPEADQDGRAAAHAPPH